MDSKWMVEYLHEWGTLEVKGVPVCSPIKGSDYFIPVFCTREQAEAFRDEFQDGNGTILELRSKGQEATV